jgi:hypothetical protein
MTAAKVRLAMAAMGQPKNKAADLCRELGVTRQTLYRHVSPEGTLRGFRAVPLLRVPYFCPPPFHANLWLSPLVPSNL